jgi:sec-independent protein translocase protein TatA
MRRILLMIATVFGSSQEDRNCKSDDNRNQSDSDHFNVVHPVCIGKRVVLPGDRQRQFRSHRQSIDLAYWIIHLGVCVIVFGFCHGLVDTPFHLISEVFMGFRNFGSLLIIFLIIMMVFGTQRLRDIGNDLAVAIRSFRKGLQEDSDENKEGKKE